MSDIALIKSEQAKLAETRAKIKERSFAKGKRKTAKNELQLRRCLAIVIGLKRKYNISKMK